ncbi:MAG: DUF1707 SHOCT-like domain-containing protein [Actinomycetota bacterium]
MAQLRIGDAERDAAVAALGEHYAAGRLTREEFDERAGRATAARFDADLAPLFADLPGGRTAVTQRSQAPVADARTSASGWRRYATPLAWLALAALVALVVISSLPWLLLLLAWFWLFAGFGGCNRRRDRRRHRRWAAGERAYVNVKGAKE